MSNQVTQEEINNFKSFMEEYAKEIGVGTSIIGELISDDFARKLLETSKQCGWEQYNNASSLEGLKRQTSLMAMKEATKYIANLLKTAAPTATMIAAIYDGWKNNNVLNESAKTLTMLATGALVGSLFAATTVPLFASIALAGLLGYEIDKYWDEGINQLSDGFAFLFGKIIPIFYRAFDISFLTTIVTTAGDISSPLVIDLDGDGVETIGSGNGVYFDHDGNGLVEQLAA